MNYINYLFISICDPFFSTSVWSFCHWFAIRTIQRSNKKLAVNVVLIILIDTKWSETVFVRKKTKKKNTFYLNCRSSSVCNENGYVDWICMPHAIINIVGYSKLISCSNSSEAKNKQMRGKKREKLFGYSLYLVLCVAAALN